MSVINLLNKKKENGTITKIEPKRNYDVPTLIWSGGAMQKNGKYEMI